MHFAWTRVLALAPRAPLQPWPAAGSAQGQLHCSVQRSSGRSGRRRDDGAACDFDESPRDAYGGITVVVGETDDFEAALTASLDRWRRDGVRGVWLEVPAALVKYLPAALDRGFTLRGGDATHVLCCAWLPGGESPLPPGPTHQVGVGAVVTDRGTPTPGPGGRRAGAGPLEVADRALRGERRRRHRSGAGGPGGDRIGRAPRGGARRASQPRLPPGRQRRLLLRADVR